MSRYSDLMAIQAPTLYWSLDDANGTGGAVAEIGGLNLTDSGSPIHTDLAAVKRAVRFTQDASYLQSVVTSLGNAANVFTQPFSISMLILVNSISTPMGLISKRINSASPGRHWAVLIFTDSALHWDLGGNQSRWNTGWVPEVGVWYHIALTWDPAENRRRLYVNGVMTATSVTQTTPTNEVTDARISVGILGGSTSSIARSTVDEPAIFVNRLLTPTEIALQAKTALPVTRIYDGTSWKDADRRTL